MDGGEVKERASFESIPCIQMQVGVGVLNNQAQGERLSIQTPTTPYMIPATMVRLGENAVEPYCWHHAISKHHVNGSVGTWKGLFSPQALFI
jgi:hypothetical protein